MVSESALDDAEKGYKMAVNKQNVARAQMTVLKAKSHSHKPGCSRQAA